MKFPYVIFVALFFLSCNTHQEVFKTVNLRLVKENDSFDEPLKGDKSPLSIYKAEAATGNEPAKDAEFPFSVKIGDTTIAIQIDEQKKIHQFRSAKFLNDEETCLLVDFKDAGDQQQKFYLIIARGTAIEAVELDRPAEASSKNSNNNNMDRIGSVAFLINNDIVLRKRDLKVFFLKRQREEQRLPGYFVLQSPDRRTLIFQQPPNKLYQVNYLSGTANTITVDPDQMANSEAFHTWIRTDFSWKKDKSGDTFLKENNNDEIIEMKL